MGLISTAQTRGPVSLRNEQYGRWGRTSHPSSTVAWTRNKFPANAIWCQAMCGDSVRLVIYLFSRCCFFHRFPCTVWSTSGIYDTKGAELLDHSPGCNKAADLWKTDGGPWTWMRSTINGSMKEGGKLQLYWLRANLSNYSHWFKPYFILITIQNSFF